MTNLLTNMILVLSILILLALLVLPLYFQQKAAVVLSGSMEPALPMGALVFTIDIEPEKIKVGDIVAFRRAEESQFTTSHRVIEVISNNGELSFRTKGDANAEADPRPVPASAIRGKILFSIPRVGYLVNSALSRVRTWPALVFLVAIPSAIVVGSAALGVNQAPSRNQKRRDWLRKRQRRWKR